MPSSRDKKQWIERAWFQCVFFSSWSCGAVLACGTPRVLSPTSFSGTPQWLWVLLPPQPASPWVSPARPRVAVWSWAGFPPSGAPTGQAQRCHLGDSATLQWTTASPSEGGISALGGSLPSLSLSYILCLRHFSLPLPFLHSSEFSLALSS